MRKLLLAAAAVSALAGATAMAQNASPIDPANGSGATQDKMNSSASQGWRSERIRTARIPPARPKR